MGLQLELEDSGLSQVIYHAVSGNYLLFYLAEPEAMITLAILQGAMH